MQGSLQFGNCKPDINVFNKQSLYDAQYIDAIKNGYECWGGNNRFFSKLNQIENILNSDFTPQSGKVLEAGCGEGVLCREFYKKGYSVTGVDISKVAIDWANRKSELLGMEIKYIHSDLSMPDINFDETYDFIIDGNCLHCIIGIDRQRFLKNLHQMLTPSGIIFISSLSSPDMANHTTIVGGLPYRFIPTEEILLAELENSGFYLIDKVVNRRNEFNHIELFLKKRKNLIFGNASNKFT
ncbi:MAG: class I SAM-dependent methyltransferase [Spirochaetae bacterium HGW-Spirochaetae-1]|jgi:2-polyprenyl-3-methyl-5-hydroxy-6-metoxy-1,4-benzoquinol methylase|nr:MAG: class I SAM-dependent methyltransferase [Spirochaetae bacterium HGW-Spirochaetae-1]